MGEGRPKVAVLYEPQSFSAMDISGAADGQFEMLWVVDEESMPRGNMIRLLERLGTVVDVSGLSMEAAADQLAAHRVDGVVAYVDTRLCLASVIAKRLSLTGNALEVSERLTDKYLQRSAFRSAGLPAPNHWRLPSNIAGPELEALVADVTYPAVVKPCQGAGSRDTELVTDPQSLMAVLELLAEARVDQPVDMVVEEYILGSEGQTAPGFADYVSVESLVSHGVVSHLAITGCFPLAQPFRETGLFLPSDLAGPLRDEVLDVTAQAIRALGITTGCVHTEIKLTPEGPRLIEVNGRVGGARPGLLASVSDLSLLQIAMRLAVGERIEFEDLVQCRGVGYLFYVQAPAVATILTGVNGLDELQNRPDVEAVYQNRKVGEKVSWRDGTKGYVYALWGHVESRDEVRDLFRHAHESVELSFA